LISRDRSSCETGFKNGCYAHGIMDTVNMAFLLYFVGYEGRQRQKNTKDGLANKKLNSTSSGLNIMNIVDDSCSQERRAKIQKSFVAKMHQKSRSVSQVTAYKIIYVYPSGESLTAVYYYSAEVPSLCKY
jgi:hypothetical protein